MLVQTDENFSFELRRSFVFFSINIDDTNRTSANGSKEFGVLGIPKSQLYGSSFI